MSIQAQVEPSYRPGPPGPALRPAPGSLQPPPSLSHAITRASHHGFDGDGRRPGAASARHALVRQGSRCCPARRAARGRPGRSADHTRLARSLARHPRVAAPLRRPHCSSGTAPQWHCGRAALARHPRTVSVAARAGKGTSGRPRGRTCAGKARAARHAHVVLYDTHTHKARKAGKHCARCRSRDVARADSAGRSTGLSRPPGPGHRAGPGPRDGPGHSSSAVAAKSAGGGGSPGGGGRG